MIEHSVKVIIGGVELILRVKKEHNKHLDNMNVKAYITIINKHKEYFGHEVKWIEPNG